jgi:putative ABC transport system permease protein
MKAFDLVRSLGGAFAHRLRASLTLLGIVIGSGSIVLLASLIVGGRTLLIDQSQGITDADVVVVEKNQAPPDKQDKTQRPLSRLDQAELENSESLDGAMVASEGSHWEMIHVEGQERWINVVSASEQTLKLYRLSIDAGRMLDGTDREKGNRVCVIGHNLYKDLFEMKPISKGGLHLKVGDELFEVVGALAMKPSMGNKNGGWNWDNKVLLPETTFDATYGSDHSVSRIYVRTSTNAQTRATARSTVMSVLLRRHLGILNFKLREDESGSNEELILMTIQVLLLGTGLLALLASGINIMNVMLVTVAERRKEIGLRRAIGATPRSILVQFLLEAAALSFVGGGLGVASGAGLAWLVALGARASLGRWNFALPAWSMALGLALAVVTGVVFGIAPAWRAAKVSPIDALRGE